MMFKELLPGDMLFYPSNVDLVFELVLAVNPKNDDAMSITWYSVEGRYENNNHISISDPRASAHITLLCDVFREGKLVS